LKRKIHIHASTILTNTEIVGPKGEVIASSNSDEEAVVLSDIDLSDARNKLITENNNLFADMRPEFYDSIV
jgi:predicted amidohydrolase